MKAWVDGAWQDWQQAQVPVLSHAFGRGSAIFEVLEVTATRQGPAYLALEEHIERLFASASAVHMQLPLSPGQLAEVLLQVARENGVRVGVAKLFCYYPGIELSVLPTDKRVSVAAFAVDFERLGVTRQQLSAPVTAAIATIRKPHPLTLPVHAKVAGMYVGGFLARSEAQRRGFDEAVLLDTEGFVAEGATASLFFAKGRTLYTAPLGKVLPGITRRCVCELAERSGLGVEDKLLRPELIEGMDEAFFTGSSVRIQPISKLENHVFAGACPGPVASELSRALDAVYAGEDERYASWLTLVG